LQLKYGGIKYSLERYNPWPHVANRHISINQLLWRRSHYDVVLIMTSFSLWRHSRAYGARSPRSHYDVILMTLFATERYGRRHGHLTAFNSDYSRTYELVLITNVYFILNVHSF